MRRNSKFDQEKELRKLYNEWQDIWNNREDHGHFIDIEPYQQGWHRSFVLRDDIKNRKDVRHIKHVLDLVNNTISCPRYDFLRWNYKHRKWEEIPQVPSVISEKKYGELPTAVQRLFVRKEVRNKYSNHTYFVYAVKYPYHFVFKIEPRMIVRRWIPDSDWETRRAEINHRIDRNGLWPRIYKMVGWRMSKWDWDNPYTNHKLGKDWDMDDYYEEVG